VWAVVVHAAPPFSIAVNTSRAKPLAFLVSAVDLTVGGEGFTR
jgi:hypothetical protein